MPLSPQAIQNVKSILDTATSGGRTGAPGLVFIAVDKAGNTLVEHASGTRSIDSNEPMTMETTFWMASMTKIVATIACLQLTEQGKMPLDDPGFVAKWAPELAKKKVLYDGVNAVDQERPITMRMLLAHTAGFGYPFLDERVAKAGRPVGIDMFSGDVKDLLESPIVNQPGSMWEYSVSIDWAGLILERSTGTKLNNYIQTHINAPLGIQHVTMFPTPEMKANLASMHQRDINGVLHERNHIYRAPLRAETPEEQDLIFNSAGGGLFARPNEYIKILTALLNDGTCPRTGNKILQKETVEMMWENQIPEHPNFARGAPPPADPFLASHSAELYPQAGSPPQGWGLSMFLTIAAGATGRGANTAWWTGIANLFWWVDRERGVAGVVAAQVLPHGDSGVVGAWARVERAVYDGLV